MMQDDGTPLIISCGTRPEIIKMSPIILALDKKKIPYLFLYTGQHHDYNLSLRFIFELGLMTNLSINLNFDKPALQIAEMIKKLHEIFKRYQPSMVLLEGDTNSVLATAITALKHGIRIGHVESGLRSEDWRMPEEHNRRVVDHISDLLFAPTAIAAKRLKLERVYGEIYLTGNTVVDAVMKYLPIAVSRSNIIEKNGLKDFIFLTLHRSENVDNPRILSNLLNALLEVEIDVVWPVHPRTKKNIIKFGFEKKLKQSKYINLIKPVGYFDCLVLEKECRLIVTDSGGIQEEATVPGIRKRVVVARDFTERPEGIKAGFARLAGTRKESLLKSINSALDDNSDLPTCSPYGDGRAAQRIINAILSHAPVIEQNGWHVGKDLRM